MSEKAKHAHKASEAKAPEHVPVFEWIRHGDGAWVLYRDGQKVSQSVEPDVYAAQLKDRPA